MDAIEAMTVLRNRRILSVFAAVSYPRQYCNMYGICMTVFYAVSVRIHGVLKHNPIIMIFHDDITYSGSAAPTLNNTLSRGNVVCLGNHAKAQWRSPSGQFLATEEARFRQVESIDGYYPSLSRLSTPNFRAAPDDGVILNGLWLCQVDNSSIPDEDILENFNYVGIYTKGTKYGKIMHCYNDYSRTNLLSR